ncbi:folate-binding protein YgfZ [Acinetobacter puyangensis]|uniref:Aminomethyltransferase folate-binding domain-containing protein n=1 Tax=Acinetobacter puyangensis TaxID=1096779 RepID=A0A240E7H3_9GAMM|nr:folate-binding Fe/S cluster repair protein [Acinetobacter puyangensis]SNX44697.1 hypothetical protein SAMN05421731_10448 [Acinetobacter puyangensis]
MSQDTLQFAHFQYAGVDAEKFLQGQVTVNVSKLGNNEFRPTAICDLKGRIQFGLWLKRQSAELIDIVITEDLAEEFAAHVKKFGAFSKATLSAASTIYPAIIDNQATFTPEENQAATIFDWQATAIQNGQAWISQATAHLFQPQELRLHQRGGVDYDKGCYLGQEIIARLWFKAKPKHWLHLIQGQGQAPNAGEQLNKDVQVVNCLNDANGWIALVTAKPESLIDLNVDVLDLPEALNGDVARPK